MARSIERLGERATPLVMVNERYFSVMGLRRGILRKRCRTSPISYASGACAALSGIIGAAPPFFQKDPVLVHPQFDPVIFSLGPLAVRWYGLMYVIGFVAVIVLGKWRVRHGPGQDITEKDVDDMLIYGVVGTILCGRLGDVLFYQV